MNKRVREKNYLLDRRLYKSRTLTDWTRLLKAGFIFQHFNIILFYFHTLMIILCFALELEKNEINIFYSKILLCNFLYSRACMTRQRRRKTMKVNIIDCTSHTHTAVVKEFHAMFIQIDDFHSKFPQTLRHRWHENKYFILISLCADKNQVFRGGEYSCFYYFNIIRKEKIAAIPRFIFMIFSFEINESLLYPHLFHLQTHTLYMY